MLPNSHLASILLALAAASSVAAHSALVAVKGDNGVTAMGFGVVASTPRNGTRRNPFQTDSSIIRDREIASGAAGPCGRTLAGGVNDVAAQLEAASAAGLPSVASNGTVTMTIHQVNGDGAGPYTCDVSADASGTNFVAMNVVQNVPGQNSRSSARATDFELVAQMPSGTACTGGPNGDACIVRCRNGARGGPFGGCAAVTNAAPATGAQSATKVIRDISGGGDQPDLGNQGGQGGIGHGSRSIGDQQDKPGQGSGGTGGQQDKPGQGSGGKGDQQDKPGRKPRSKRSKTARGESGAGGAGQPGTGSQGGQPGQGGQGSGYDRRAPEGDTGASGGSGDTGATGGSGDTGASGGSGDKPKKRFLRSRIAGVQAGYWI
ncbi:hypothetical protein CTheo_7801 [Ceratobasidium theobromae]|uniref:GEgh 16 protein n=1 Tax=Ceratobasidium theobromae TaxID=1582974 RepID=A0A5N5QBK4_9AGAM|nr:hypothetical protein CTheo_7801 [Ceratobasidium theobromae]